MADETKPDEPKKGGGMMKIVKAVVIVAVLVVVEMVGAAMLIPSAEETEALARELARANRGEEAIVDEGDAAAIDAAAETREVELHAQNITRFNPETDVTMNVDFAVFGVVLAEEAEEFDSLYTANMNRIREQIVMTMHGAEASDLSIPGLGLIRRQIREKTNRALGKPLVQEVVFTKINFVER
ncbi:MAG: flagellar basal body-associated FliL family protein [Planctomycetota bacterium]